MTAEKFIPNPFSEYEGARLYKTGDVARFLPDGSIEFLGRIDHQVKIRGYRIELGEIETVLRQHPAIEDVVVIARKHINDDTRLVAYVVASHSELSDLINKARRFLRERLPEYMVPSAFVVLDALPLSPNGKVDRKALPAPELSKNDLDSTFVAPRTPVEERLAAMWRETLGVEKISIYHDFFELGGHSLLLTQLASRIRKTFHTEVPLRILLDNSTLVEMSQTVLACQVEQADKVKVAQMLKRLKQMSPDETKNLLKGQTRIN